MCYFTAVWIFIGFCNSPTHYDLSFELKGHAYFNRYALVSYLSKMFLKFELTLLNLTENLNTTLTKRHLIITCTILYHLLVVGGLVLKKTTNFKKLLGEGKKTNKSVDQENSNLTEGDFFDPEKIEIFGDDFEKINKTIKTYIFLALKTPI